MKNISGTQSLMAFIKQNTEKMSKAKDLLEEDHSKIYVE